MERTTHDKAVVDKDVSDLQSSTSALRSDLDNLKERLEEKVADLKEHGALKRDLEKMKSEWRGNLLVIVVPLLASLVTAVVLLFTALYSN